MVFDQRLETGPAMTSFPREIAEAALAHTLGEVERAYRRGDALARRRELMKAWSEFLTDN